ncbi:hypothetical protein O7600_20170 [Micromonospora sp. WMMA1998]|uniref:hypothetical protein n=1 Tax=Micromonospora sp. WMMA1998 TaxID=3015167 RepID=UPI00248C3346|nr:hypothetical protein [Micromonospora sp. WMMA1998]WBC13448.1 hypothetical protein O7600_20170 [Micromonospora sp. WMMA1998]
MISVADIRSYDTRVDTDAARRIAEAWNLVYPHMRAALTGVIDGNRRFLAEADRFKLTNERKAALAQAIKDNERWRRELGQLDRSTLPACSGSGGFSVSTALALVTPAIAAFSWDSPHLGDAFRLAAALADVVGARTAARQAAEQHAPEATR